MRLPVLALVASIIIFLPQSPQNLLINQTVFHLRLLSGDCHEESISLLTEYFPNSFLGNTIYNFI